MDIGATYHVKDARTNQAIGSIRRKALKSIIKDEWVFNAADGRELGKLTEKSTGMALLSRIINIIPQSYIIVSSDGKTDAFLDQHFNLFVLKYTLSFNEQDYIV